MGKIKKVVLKLTVPPGAGSGSTLSVEVQFPNSPLVKSNVTVVVPEGRKSGDEFLVTVDEPAAAAGTETETGAGVPPGLREPEMRALSTVPARSSMDKQLQGIVSKSLALQATQRCFNCGSCCCVGFAVLLTWVLSLVDPITFGAGGSNCTGFDGRFQLAVPR